MSQTMHLSLSVRGAIKWPLRKLNGMFRDPASGRRLNGREVREHLLDLLAEGHEMLPMANCPGHDPKRGCPGHEEPST